MGVEPRRLCCEGWSVAQPSEQKFTFIFLFPRRITALHLPRFSVSGDYKLHDILPHLGIKKVFSHQADLSGITDQARLEVSQVSLHTGQSIFLIGG